MNLLCGVIGLLMTVLATVDAAIAKRDICDATTVTVFVPPGPGPAASVAAATTVALPASTITLTETTQVAITTVTVQMTKTEVVSLVEASAAAASADQGPYAFSVSDGITIWLGGKTPAPSVSGVIEATTVLVIPLPTAAYGSTGLGQPGPVVTSISTVTQRYYDTVTELITIVVTSPRVSTAESTITSVVHITSTVFLTSTLTSIRKTAFPTLTVTGGMGVVPQGWNGTSVYSSGTAVSAPVSSPSLATISDPIPALVNASSTMTSFLNSPSTAPFLNHSSVVPGRYRRQVGATVTATIDGVVVTWINTYDGSGNAPKTSAESLASTSTTGLDPYPTYGSIPQPSVSASTLSVVMSSSRTIPVNSDISKTSTDRPTYSSTTTSTTTAATPATATTGSCTGLNSGAFTINFDDLPRLGESPSSDQYPPIFSPYHKLFWSQGFAYVPPPTDPFLPHSGDQLAMFIVDGSANVHSQNLTGVVPSDVDVNGMFGAGPRYASNAFWFDAYSAYLGCQNTGPKYCQLKVEGYTLDEASGTSVVTAEQYFYQEPCADMMNCKLLPIEFGEAFRNLTALQVVATIEGDETDTPLSWYADDFKLGWSNTTCAATQLRNRSR